jgi:hypothetical protein
LSVYRPVFGPGLLLERLLALAVRRGRSSPSGRIRVG